MWVAFHVFVRATNRSDSAARFDPAGFAALLRDGTQRSYPGAEELAELLVNGYRGKKTLDSQQKQEWKHLEIKFRRDLTAENILSTGSSVKLMALGPSASGGIAIGGRGAEALKEYKAADIPLTLFCSGKRVGVVSKPGTMKPDQGQGCGVPGTAGLDRTGLASVANESRRRTRCRAS